MKNADMPAMPFVDFDYDGHAAAAYHGLTKREHFAAMAMQGMLAHATRYRPRSQDQHMHWHSAMAKEATEIADATLAELECTS